MNSVYFARFGDCVKIGFSSHPETRYKQLGKITYPDDFDHSAAGELVLVIPFCRMRDERNLQMLFGNHWAIGEWFHWTPAFRFQMETMQYVTHETRAKYLRKARRDLGVGGSHAKPYHGGKTTQEHLAELHGRAS